MNKIIIAIFIVTMLTHQVSSYFLRSPPSGVSTHQNHRRLSTNGRLDLKIKGRGYFQYRLRHSIGDSSADFSQQSSDTYDGAYTASDFNVLAEASSVSSITVAAGDIQLGKGSPLVAGDILTVSAVSGETCAAAGTYTVVSVAANVITTSLPADVIVVSTCTVSLNHAGNSAQASAGHYADGQGLEDTAEPESGFFSQVVYSRDGNVHINRYGYLCDDNGFLLVGVGAHFGDIQAKHHIHIPSRANDVIVTPRGQVLADEGSAFTDCGIIKLVRFENPQGLDIALEMKSRCAAANMEGFALGNWCKGTERDGKNHIYFSETQTSGAGILGSPGDLGFGRIDQQ